MQRLVAEFHFQRARHHVGLVTEIVAGAARDERRDRAETRLLDRERAGARDGGDNDGRVGGFFGRHNDLSKRW